MNALSFLFLARLAAAPQPQAPVPAPAAVCFAPDTPPEYVEEIARNVIFRGASLEAPEGEQDFQFVDGERWRSTAISGSGLSQGDPTVITWSVVPDGTPITPYYTGESADASGLRAWLDGLYGSEGVWLPILQGVLERWSELTGLTFVHEPNDDRSPIGLLGLAGVRNVRADVRIAGHRIDGDGNVLAYNYFPANGDMVLDVGDSYLEDKTNSSRILRNTLSHEHGHGFGIRHVCPVSRTKLMEPFLGTNFEGPQFDDQLAGNRAYGDDLEKNDTVATATALGPIGDRETRERTGVSVDDELDHDVFRFEVAQGSTVSVKLTPLGPTYLNGAELGPGRCEAGISFNALAQQDLGVDVLSSDGLTTLARANRQPAGGTETLTDVALTAGAGNYYVRVFGTSANKVQLYSLAVTVNHSATVVPDVYESEARGSVVAPPNRVGSAASSPFDLAPKAISPLYYQVDDGTGNPPLIQMVKGGQGVLIYF